MFLLKKKIRNYGISVVNLEATTKKPLISSDRAKSFKEVMHNRAGIQRKPGKKLTRISKTWNFKKFY